MRCATGNLDSSTGAAIMNLLGHVARDDGADRAVVMVTHDMSAAQQTDRIVTVQDGTLRSDVTPGVVTRPGGRHSQGVRDQPTEIIPTIHHGVFTRDARAAPTPPHGGRHSAHRF